MQCNLLAVVKLIWAVTMNHYLNVSCFWDIKTTNIESQAEYNNNNNNSFKTLQTLPHHKVLKSYFTISAVVKFSSRFHSRILNSLVLIKSVVFSECRVTGLHISFHMVRTRD